MLTEDAAQARLIELRRQRDALERKIVDLALYLELGRRLASTEMPGAEQPADLSATGDMERDSPPLAPQGVGRTHTIPQNPDGYSAASPLHAGRGGMANDAASFSDCSECSEWKRSSSEDEFSRMSHESGVDRSAHGPAPALKQNKNASESVPSRDVSLEKTSARRRGRALLEAALALLEEARRPLHAREILTILSERGFEVAGRDPVAALNTRLWKRAVRGGRLRRLGDAVYQVSESSTA